MKDIEQFLRENAPETPAEGQFMIETNARLDAVEGIKNTVAGEHRRWRRILLVTLIAGLVLGCVVTALVILYPVQLDHSALSKAIESLRQWEGLLFGFIAVCSISLALLAMIKKPQML